MAQAGNRVHGTTREVPLQRFVEVERSLLAPLPDVAPVLAIWAKVKVYRDAHVQFEQRYYLYCVINYGMFPTSSYIQGDWSWEVDWKRDLNATRRR